MGEHANKGFQGAHSSKALSAPRFSNQSSQSQSLTLTNRLMASHEMREAFSLLQMPILEAIQFVHLKVEENPLFEIMSESEYLSEQEEFLEQFEPTSDSYKGGETFKESFDMENWLPYQPSWFEDLSNQLKELFPSQKEFAKAQKIVGNFNNRGYLDLPTEEIAALNHSTPEEIEALLEKIKLFFEGSVGCKNLQESLLYQLENRGLKEGLAYQIIGLCYEDLLARKFKEIARRLQTSEPLVRTTIENEIASLNLSPHYGNSVESRVELLIPDIIISSIEGKLYISLNEEELPQLKINQEYVDLFNQHTLPKESQHYLKEKISQGLWLLKTLKERNKTLYKIAEELVVFQKEYFSKENGHLKPMTIRQMAEKIELHESTVSRAVTNKYLTSDKGTVALKSFFTSSIQTAEGESASSSEIKERVKSLIINENKLNPLSDEELAGQLEKEGFICARRTISKYRQELKIPSKRERKSS